MEIAIVLILLAVAVIAFSTEKVSVDIVTMSCVLILVLTGIITYKEAFAPFGSDFIIMLASIFIVTSAIDSSGVLEQWASKLLKRSPGSKLGLIMPMISITGIFSSVMNNTTVTALMVNPAMAIAKKSGINFSKVLLPLAFASIVGGTCTLIGTSTNVAVNAYLGKNGFTELGMWDFTWIGLILLGVTLLFMAVIGVRMMPERKSEDLTGDYGIREYLSEVKILPNSALIGQVIAQSDIVNMGFSVLAVIRGDRQFAPGENISFREGDIVLVKGVIQQLIAVKQTKGIDIVADTLDFYQEDKGQLRLVEMVIPGRSNLAGLSIAESEFRRKYGMVVVAINREGDDGLQQRRDVADLGRVALAVVQVGRDRAVAEPRQPPADVLDVLVQAEDLLHDQDQRQVLPALRHGAVDRQETVVGGDAVHAGIEAVGRRQDGIGTDRLHRCSETGGGERAQELATGAILGRKRHRRNSCKAGEKA